MGHEQVEISCKYGMLNILTVLPHEEVETQGIPFVQYFTEENASSEEVEKWDPFWDYFCKTMGATFEGLEPL